jgi:hypothetical protein
MPFARELFDFVHCSAAFKNFSEPVKALDEMHPVLWTFARMPLSMTLIPMGSRAAGAGSMGGVDLQVHAGQAGLYPRRIHSDRPSRAGSASANVGPVGFEVRLTSRPKPSVAVS